MARECASGVFLCFLVCYLVSASRLCSREGKPGVRVQPIDAQAAVQLLDAPLYAPLPQIVLRRAEEPLHVGALRLTSVPFRCRSVGTPNSVVYTRLDSVLPTAKWLRFPFLGFRTAVRRHVVVPCGQEGRETGWASPCLCTPLPMDTPPRYAALERLRRS